MTAESIVSAIDHFAIGNRHQVSPDFPIEHATDESDGAVTQCGVESSGPQMAQTVHRIIGIHFPIQGLRPRDRRFRIGFDKHHRVGRAVQDVPKSNFLVAWKNGSGAGHA